MTLSSPFVVFLALTVVVVLWFILLDRISARRHRRFETLPADDDVTERFTAGDIVESRGERKTPVGKITLVKRRQ